MNFTAKSIRRTRQSYWMHDYAQFPHGLNNNIRYKFKTDYTHTNFANKFLSIPRKHGCANRDKDKKGDPLLLP